MTAVDAQVGDAEVSGRVWEGVLAPLVILGSVEAVSLAIEQGRPGESCRGFPEA